MGVKKTLSNSFNIPIHIDGTTIKTAYFVEATEKHNRGDYMVLEFTDGQRLILTAEGDDMAHIDLTHQY